MQKQGLQNSSRLWKDRKRRERGACNLQLPHMEENCSKLLLRSLELKLIFFAVTTARLKFKIQGRLGHAANTRREEDVTGQMRGEGKPEKESLKRLHSGSHLCVGGFHEFTLSKLMS
jgi:hypothetical protein